MFYLYRAAIPFFKYPFIALFITYLILSRFDFKSLLKTRLIEFLQNYYLFCVLAFLFFVAFVNSNKSYLESFKDLINLSIIAVIFFKLSLLISTKIQLRFFISKFIILNIPFALLISISGLLNTLDVISIGNIPANNIFFDLHGTNITPLDYNFALLPDFFAIIGIVLFVEKTEQLAVTRIFLTIMLQIFSFHIILSGSRRGLFILILTLIIFLGAALISFGKTQTQKKLYINISLYIFPFTGFLLLLYFFVFFTSFTFKSKTIRFIGAKNEYLAKSNITSGLYKYTSIFIKDVSPQELYNRLWSINFNPKDPNNGWGSGKFKIAFPLRGENVGLIPPGSIGFLLDSTSISKSWGGNAYSFSQIMTNRVDENSGIEASVFCFVSNNFNGDKAGLTAEGSVTGNILSEYDLTKKGTWQKLKLEVKCNSGNVKLELFFMKNKVNNFSSLTGNIIFAYPQYTIKKEKYIFDSRDPDSGWGERIHKTIFPLTGKNVEIVPSDAKGYLIDSTSNEGSSEHHAFSFSLIGKSVVDITDTLYASVYCFVSKDFNGSNVCIRADGSTSGNIVSEYNIKNKETWQKLSIRTNCQKGEARVFLYLNKTGVTSFSYLRGFVIFAYPQFQIVHVKENYSGFIEIKKENSSKTSEVISNTSFVNKQTEAGICNYDLLMLFAKLQVVNDHDLIRRLTSNLISEDTTFFPLKHNLVVDTLSNRFIDLRIIRWKFAFQIFSKEYNLSEKIFGGGFNFLNWYGFRFFDDKTKSDYPHNPMLSVLLYSGLVGLIIYLVFIIKVFLFYIRYRKSYPIPFIFFIITFFYSFFSAGSPFDPPIMGFFAILPFFIHSIHKKDRSEINSL